MYPYTDVPRICENSSDDDTLWMNLYPMLLPKAQRWVYNSGVLVWRGQEYDVAWDIVLTAIARTFEYIRKARAQDIIVHAPEHLAVVIAKNHYRDLQRHEWRMQRFASDEMGPGEYFSLNNLANPEEEAAEKVYEESLLSDSARNIAQFSNKLRSAILTDLANRMHFGAEPTALQQAFLSAGIRLQEYRRPRPTDPGERSRQSALRSMAYKRVAQLTFGLNTSLARQSRENG